jgi:SAM-dependent methyltransferase
MSDNNYHTYLLKRSLLSRIYRTFILYPKLSKQFHGRVLDIGCGIGDFLRFRKNTVGVDINKFNVDYCRSENLEAFVIENGKYPFSAETFEGAILDNVVEHLIDPIPALLEAKRILRKDGILIIGVPGKKGYTMDDDHKKFYDDKTLPELLVPLGFAFKKIIYAPLMLKSKMLDEGISQYCVYGVFVKT